MIHTSDEPQNFVSAAFPIDSSLLMEPLEPLNSPDLVTGYFDVEVPITPLASPEVHVSVASQMLAANHIFQTEY